MSDRSTSHDFDALRRTRDELLLQMHLAQSELKEEWEKVEVKWSRLQGEAHRLKDAASAPAHEVREAVDTLAKDVGESYARIRDALRRPA